MAPYLIEVAYTPQAWASLIRNPQDRVEAVRPAVEALGGRLEGAWFAFGEYDLLVVVQMPDNKSAAALALAFAAGGALRATKTTPLMSVGEGLEAMRKAGSSAYKPPAG